MAQHIHVALHNYAGTEIKQSGDFVADRTNGNNNLIMIIKAINPKLKCPIRSLLAPFTTEDPPIIHPKKYRSTHPTPHFQFSHSHNITPVQLQNHSENSSYKKLTNATKINKNNIQVTVYFLLHKFYIIKGHYRKQTEQLMADAK